MHVAVDLLSGVGVRSSNSTPVGGASAGGSSAPSRKSPLGDLMQGGASQKEDTRASSRGSGGRPQGDQQRSQRGSNGSTAGGAAGGRGNLPRGGRARGRAPGQGSFNRFAGNFNRNAKGPLKFEEDYDFESANTKVRDQIFGSEMLLLCFSAIEIILIVDIVILDTYYIIL